MEPPGRLKPFLCHLVNPNLQFLFNISTPVLLQNLKYICTANTCSQQTQNHVWEQAQAEMRGFYRINDLKKKPNKNQTKHHTDEKRWHYR